MKKMSIVLKVLLLATLTLTLLLPVSVFADEAAAPIAHDACIDTTGDGYCDIDGCDKKLPCTDHVDVDGDGYCDISDCDGCIEHIDESDDGKCDKELCGVCIEHRDTDPKDNICDNCNACLKHSDADKNKVCDNCNLCIKHIDNDKDKKCDNCSVKTSSNTFGTPEWSKNVFESLKMLGIGMIGIFLVIGLIILVIYVLNRFINMSEKKEKEN